MNLIGTELNINNRSYICSTEPYATIGTSRHDFHVNGFTAMQANTVYMKRYGEHLPTGAKGKRDWTDGGEHIRFPAQTW